MRTRVAKWGNSYAIRIPKQIIEDLELAEDVELVLSQKQNGFSLLKPDREARLADLLKGVSAQREIDWGSVRGKEIW